MFLGLNKPNTDRQNKDNTGNPILRCVQHSSVNCPKATAINAFR